MKTGSNKIAAAIVLYFGLAFFALQAYAIGSIIVAVLIPSLEGWMATALAFAINVAVSAVIAKSSASDMSGDLSGDSKNPGNRQMFPPATDNKIPVVYGSAWVGGTIVDMSISTDNQWMNYVLALSEVTDSGEISFGDIYFGGRKCIFDSANPYKVTALKDMSTNVEDSVAGNLFIYKYHDGSFSPDNTSFSAVEIMQGSGPNPITLTYLWTPFKKMTKCAFAIVQIKYSQTANLTGLQQTKFNIINSLSSPGACFSDYLTSTRYGAGLDSSQIDQDSLDSLDTYSAGSFQYYDPTTSTYKTQARFRFDGVVDTNRSVLDNLQEMATSCDCLLKYNEISGQWGVIVQQPTYSVAMQINDSNMVGGIMTTPLDISNSYNIIEAKFPDSTNQDSFSTATFDIRTLNPSLMYPNEPINKQSVTLSMVNNNVRAQYIANRLLEAGREDLQITIKTTFVGIQLEAGDVVSVTSANYSWTGKLFRIIKITENFSDEGVVVDLILAEFNPQVYDDKSITMFEPSPNTGLPNALSFGTIPAPVINGITKIASSPFFNVNITTPSNGVVTYAEIYRSALSNPSTTDLIFEGTTEIKPNGDTYPASTAIPAVPLYNVPAGDWYFFAKMVNSLGKSPLSPPSAILYWRPETYQYTTRYLNVAYATNSTGTTGFNLNPRNKTWYGLYPSDSIDASTDPTKYKWYQATTTFGAAGATARYLIYTNWGNRSFSFSTGLAEYAAGTGKFVASQSTIYDQSFWAALPDGSNYIDLDVATGQFLTTGSTASTGTLQVSHDQTGKVFVSLQKYLSFAGGAPTKTASAATITIDEYGRVVGFNPPDTFNMTVTNFQSNNGQTSFTGITRSSTYISGQCLVFQNGILLDTSEYTDSAGSTGTVTFPTGRTTGTKITVISFRSVTTVTAGQFVVGKVYTIVSTGSTDFTLIGAANSSPGTVFTATGVGTGTGTADNVYATFTRNTQAVTNVSIITPSGYTVRNGFEFVFMNGVPLYDADYDIDTIPVVNTITNFPAPITGTLTYIQWAENNLGQRSGAVQNIVTSTASGVTNYSFPPMNAGGFNLYENGVLLINGSTTPAPAQYDYTITGSSFILSNTPSGDFANLNNLLQQQFDRAGAA